MRFIDQAVECMTLIVLVIAFVTLIAFLATLAFGACPS